MSAARIDRSVTPDELRRMEDDGVFEAARGRLVEKQPNADENWTVGRVGYFVSDLVRRRSPGDVLWRQSFQCFDDPATVRRPDIAFLAAGRVPYPTPPGHLDIRPDLAVEAFSALDDETELDLRLTDYRTAGSRHPAGVGRDASHADGPRVPAGRP